MMMRRWKKTLGFSLVEMAIVLAITGVLFGGLYRLFSGGNQQVKDTSVASQQVQLINAVGGYLGTGDGQTWMGGEGGSANHPLPLPNAANAPDGGANTNCKTYLGKQDTSGTGKLKTFCDALPAGFSSATVNAYGQTYSVQVQVGTITAPAVVPSTYSFMIATTGGDVISDADGGGISSQIGNDGGFIYSLAATCTSPTGVAYQACGTYGSWYANLTGAVAPVYGFGGFPGGGHVASRSYVSPEFNSGQPWLARKLMPSDVGAPKPNYNTMQTALLLGGQTFFFGKDIKTPDTPGTIDAQGGTINMSAGTLNMNAGTFNANGGPINMNAGGSATGGGTIFLAAGGGINDTASNGNVLTIFPTGPIDAITGKHYLSVSLNASSQLLGLTTNCSVDSNLTVYKLHYDSTSNGGAGDSPTGANNDCPPALNVTGDVNIVGELQSEALFAGTFIYNGSDRRLKKDILPIEDGLEDLMRIQPVSFIFKATGEKGLGFIAQDLEKIYPELVTPKKGDSMKSVNYEGLIAPLVRAVQELKKQNDELREQLNAQKLRQDQLDQRLKQKSE